MAKISMGALAGEVRGKVGGVVFSKGRQGPVVRNRVTPANPRTTAQVNIRAYQTAASREFAALSTTNLNLWNAAAAAITRHDPVSGTQYGMDGISYYSQLRTKMLEANPAAAQTTTPPASTFAGDTITVSVAGGAGSMTFTGSGANGTNISTRLAGQRLKSPNRKPTPKGYRLLTYKAFAGGSLTQVVNGSPGTYAVGYAFVQKLTGQTSQFYALGKVVLT